MFSDVALPFRRTEFTFSDGRGRGWGYFQGGQYDTVKCGESQVGPHNLQKGRPIHLWHEQIQEHYVGKIIDHASKRPSRPLGLQSTLCPAASR